MKKNKNIENLKIDTTRTLKSNLFPPSPPSSIEFQHDIISRFKN
jgi:hypothetical protein